MKTIKTAISMPEDLYQEVREYAGDKPFSTTICDLIRQALGIDTSILSYTGTTGASIRDLLTDLSSRVTALEAREVLPGGITPVIPGTPSIGGGEVVTGAIPSADNQSQKNETEIVKEAGLPHDHDDHYMIIQRSQDRDHIKSASDHETEDCTYLDTTTTKYMITEKNHERVVVIDGTMRSCLVRKLDERRPVG